MMRPMPTNWMPDEALATLEGAGFATSVRGETLVVGLSNRSVRRREIAAVLGCRTEDLLQAGREVEVHFTPPAPEEASS